MCGIAGYISKLNIGDHILFSMMDQLKHRGPDGMGHYYDVSGSYRVAIGHRRLSILDLSDNGRQPMISEDGNVVLSFNGEIYNFRQLKNELENKGYCFRTGTDSEVILLGYIEWGVSVLTRLNGMFALGIYDRSISRIFIARDRVGEKPLYYIKNDSGLYFASELNSLKLIPNQELTINKSALASYLWQMYIPAPFTIYNEAEKVLPGHYLAMDLMSGEISDDCYWDSSLLYLHSKKEGEYHEYLSEDERLDYLDELLIKSVSNCLVADVPVGTFLSGGIDSSLITAIAQRVSNGNIKTFSIGFYEPEYDESAYAKEIANKLECEHNEMICSINEALKFIKEIPKAYSEPFADNSQIPTLLLCKYAKDNITVALTGDGGDELFCGYPTYPRLEKMQRSGRLAKIVDSIHVEKLFDSLDYDYWRVKKFSNMKMTSDLIDLDQITAMDIIDRMLIRCDDGCGGKGGLVEWYKNQIPERGLLPEMAMYRDLKVALPDDMLVKVDRASMYYSLETRAPFLDKNIVEWSLGMTYSQKYYKNTLKAPLRQLAYRYLSRELMDRPKKGFGVPINKWLHAELQEELKDYLDENFIDRQGIFDAKFMTRMYDAFVREKSPILDRLMWTYLNFQMWADIWL